MPENKDSKKDIKKEELDKKAPSKAAPKKSVKTSAKASANVEAADKAPKAKKPKGTSGAKRAPLATQTTFAKTGQVQGKWRVVDATGIALGRLSSRVAMILMGKDKAIYTPNQDTGDFVVVINAEKVHLSGKKWDQKTYYHHTNYPGGIKSQIAKEVRDNNPERLVEWSVWGMLPKSKGHLVRHWFKKLKVYAGPEHPHKAQQVEVVKMTNIGGRGSEV